MLPALSLALALALALALGQRAAVVVRVRADVGGPLGGVAAHQQDAQRREDAVEDDVEAKVRREALPVPRRVARLEDLRRRHVAHGPADERQRQRRRLLGLPRDVARDEREDEVALRQEELRAVEGDEQPDARVVRRRDRVDDGGADDGRTRCRLWLAKPTDDGRAKRPSI